MSQAIFRICLLLLAGLLASPAWSAVNSYRFLHVTIDTPWHLFLFLLMGVFAPFILMVVLMWRHSLRKRHRPDAPDSGKPPQP
jgi:hypothetical protein